MKKTSILFLISILICSYSFSQERSRSSKTGRYVTKKYAKEHKSTTYTSKTKKSK